MDAERVQDTHRYTLEKQANSTPKAPSLGIKLATFLQWGNTSGRGTTATFPFLKKKSAVEESGAQIQSLTSAPSFFPPVFSVLLQLLRSFRSCGVLHLSQTCPSLELLFTVTHTWVLGILCPPPSTTWITPGSTVLRLPPYRCCPIFPLCCVVLPALLCRFLITCSENLTG